LKLRTTEWEVRPITLSVAEHIVANHHYAGKGANTGIFHGLFRRGENTCRGVAWWIPPTRLCAEASFQGDWKRVLTLSRLAVTPDVPPNGASFLIGQSIKRIRKTRQWDCLITYADTGEGHSGAIYRATNWEYLGLTKPEQRFEDSEGRIVARKAGPKTRTRAEMAALGYSPTGSHQKHKFRLLITTAPLVSPQPLLFTPDTDQQPGATSAP